MFRLHTSNDAAKLASALGERLRAPQANPLLPTRVLVPQAGLKRWLQAHLAEQLCIIANVEFVPPAQFTWELLRAARPDLPQRSPFDVEVLRWHLYDLLDAPPEGKALAPLREYLQTGDDPLRRYALSFELARAFERMQGYRRERLLAWERGAGKDDWQAELWRRLLPRVGGASRAARVDDWLRRFDPEYARDEFHAKPKPPGLPDSLACFACANVSPDVLRTLAVAGRHCDVDFYLPLPSMEYLGELPRTRAAVRARLGEHGGENPLVLSLGGALSDFVVLLFGYEHVQPDIEHDDYDEDIPRTTLLGRMRDDILKHRVPAPDEPREPLPDPSLQFHACHTALREVQTLHDALLAMFEKHPDLRPRDVAVMMPDVAAYRPAIEAVFGNAARGDPRWLPFNLGDLGAASVHPAAALFLKLLDAPSSRWEVDELTDVLASPGVQRRFDLDADAATRLARRVCEAGVRWGQDEHMRKDCGGYREFSWAFGIDRIVAGFATGDDGALSGGTAPLAGVEGAAFGHLDAILGVTETWRRLRDRSREILDAARWQTFLNDAFDSLYQADPDDVAETRALERIRAALATLADDTAAAGADIQLPWADVRAFLRDALAAPEPAQRLFTGGITFCSMVPLRVVPFRVICLIGMDEAAFPRRATNSLDPLLADRRAGNPEKGDRDVRADDRLLFLQLLAAAKDAFYVSWVGRDAQSNKDLPPSVVAWDLMECVREHYLAPPADRDAKKHRDAWLPQAEPLHPFDRRLFAAMPSDARSYASQWLPAANARTRSAEGPPPFVPRMLPAAETPRTEIRLDDLKRFFDDPAKGFLVDGLDMRLPRGAEAEASLEPLQPDQPLLRHDLTRALLEYGNEDAVMEAVRLRAEGRLPPGGFADEALAIARERAGALQGLIDDYTRGSPLRDGITATIALAGGARVGGSVGGMYAPGLVRAKPGGLDGRHALRAFIDMLFATVARRETTRCRLFWIDKDAARHCDLAPFEPADASAKLAELVDAMQAGLRAPLPLLTRASWAALKRERKQKGEAGVEEFIDNLRDAADKDDDHSQGSEFDSAAFGIAWRGVDFNRADPAALMAFHATAAKLFPELVHPRRGKA